MDENKNDHATVGESFKIDQRAMKAFKKWMPDDWLPRKEDPDFHVDFVVETVEDGEPTGVVFAVQIKGIKAQKKQKLLRFSFKTKHLRYFLNRCQYPVFLVRINTETEEGYWVFAQRYIKERIQPHMLLSQKTATVLFSPADNFKAWDRFTSALDATQNYMRELRPSSIQAAVRKRQEELEAKDPRFSVSVTVQHGKESININPKEDIIITGKIRITNKDGFRDFIERGSDLYLKPGEFAFQGSPLLEELTNGTTGHFVISHGIKNPGNFQIVLTEKTLGIMQVDGMFTSGTRYTTFEGALQNAPLEMTLTLEIKEDETVLVHRCSIKYSMIKWIGQPISLLSHFEQLKCFAESFAAKQALTMHIFVRGNRLGSGILSSPNPKGFEPFLFQVEWLRKLREVAAALNINLFVPSLSKISNKNWAMIEVVHALLNKREISIPGRTYSVWTTASGSVSDEKFRDAAGILRLDNAEESFSVLGEQVLFKNVRHEFTDMKISTAPNKNGEVRFYFESTSQTTERISLF